MAFSMLLFTFVAVLRVVGTDILDDDNLPSLSTTTSMMDPNTAKTEIFGKNNLHTTIRWLPDGSDVENFNSIGSTTSGPIPKNVNKVSDEKKLENGKDTWEDTAQEADEESEDDTEQFDTSRKENILDNKSGDVNEETSDSIKSNNDMKISSEVLGTPLINNGTRTPKNGDNSIIVKHEKFSVTDESSNVTNDSSVFTHKSNVAHESSIMTQENTIIRQKISTVTKENATLTQDSSNMTSENSTMTHEKSTMTQGNAIVAHDSSIMTHKNSTTTQENSFVTLLPKSNPEQNIQQVQEELKRAWVLKQVDGGNMSLTNITLNVLDPFKVVSEMLPGTVLNDHQNYLSCADRCGLLFTVPCSCQSSCLVYKNCCYDFDTECPNILSEAVQRIGTKVLEAPVECVTRSSSSLMVTKCPEDDLENNGEESKLEEIGPMTFSNFSEAQYQKMLDTGPYTDASTGVTYINKNVFNCYATERSVPKHWGTVVHFASEIDITANAFTNFNTLLNLSDFTFIPPSDVSIQACSDAVIDSCPKKNVSQTIKYMCTEGWISYVKILKYRSTEGSLVFKNVHCLLCNLDEHPPEVIYSTVKLPLRGGLIPEFGVLMRTTEDSKIVLTEEELSPPFWKQLVCDLKAEPMSCKPTSCKKPEYNSVDDDCLPRIKLMIRLDNHFNDFVGEIQKDLVCYLQRVKFIREPVLHELEDTKEGYHDFYIHILSSDQNSPTAQKLRNPIFEIMGYWLYNMAGEMREEETREEKAQTTGSGGTNDEKIEAGEGVQGRNGKDISTFSPRQLTESSDLDLTKGSLTDNLGDVTENLVFQEAWACMISTEKDVSQSSSQYFDRYCRYKNVLVLEIPHNSSNFVIKDTSSFNRSQCKPLSSLRNNVHSSSAQVLHSLGWEKEVMWLLIFVTVSVVCTLGTEICIFGLS